MDIIQLIEELEDLIEDAGSVPFSKKVTVDADQVYDIIHDMRQNLPEEIKQASWVNEERDRILEEAHREAEVIISDSNKEREQIIQSARSQFNQMVEEHQIVVEARERAQNIQANSEQTARTMRMESVNYVDAILSRTQDNLKEVINTLEENREELRQD